MLNADQVHTVHRLGGKEVRDGTAYQGWARRELWGGAFGQNASESVHECVRIVPVEVSHSIAHQSCPQGTAQHRHEAAVVPSSAFRAIAFLERTAVQGMIMVAAAASAAAA